MTNEEIMKMTETELMDKYEVMFGRRKLPMSQTTMCWGLDIEKGWYPIIVNLCEELIKLGIGDKFRFDQVKEKFGGLRVYWSIEYNENDEDGISNELYRKIENLVDKAEVDSESICEICGEEGDILSSGGSPFGWLKTLCPTHALELNYAKPQS